MDDYFSNIEDPNKRKLAMQNYVYNELVVRAPPISVGSRLSRAIDVADSVLGRALVNRLVAWATDSVLQKGSTLRDIPSSYAIVHNDLFNPSILAKKCRLASGHYIGEFEKTRVGLMACRRGALEALLQADALGRMGVKRIFFMGTCLRISREVGPPKVVVPTSYISELNSGQPIFPAAATSSRLSALLLQNLNQELALAEPGKAYIAHKFLLEESPSLLLALAEAGISAVEMEGLGFVSGLQRYHGEVAVALIGLDQFWPEHENHFLNIDLGSYVEAARLSKVVLRAGLCSLVAPSF